MDVVFWAKSGLPESKSNKNREKFSLIFNFEGFMILLFETNKSMGSFCFALNPALFFVPKNGLMHALVQVVGRLKLYFLE